MAEKTIIEQQGISISAEFNTVVMNGVTIDRAADDHLFTPTHQPAKPPPPC